MYTVPVLAQLTAEDLLSKLLPDLSKEQALQVAAWALKVAAQNDDPVSFLNAIRHQVLGELVELPENYG